MPIARALVVVALALASAVPAGAAPGPPPAPSGEPTARPPADSTDGLSWARRVVQARRAVEAAEAEGDPDRQAELAARAFQAASALAEGPTVQASVRELVVRAQAAYEPHHGAAAALALGPAELAELRGDALAGLSEDDWAPPLVDPAVEAAARAQAARLAAALAAEAARADGPAHLFYPAEAAALVDGQRGAAARLSRSARRGRRTLRSIERTLRRRGLPTELQYVAVIESALNPQAESWAGARGLWQFMPETAAEFGLDSLTVADPAASTEAAARYLRQLTRMFRGDVQLALAAYNCGPGRVRRLVRAHRRETGHYPTFWDLHDELPEETQDYVPRFIAVAEALG